MENIVKEKISNESENSATIQQKQKFKTLDDVLNDNNNAIIMIMHHHKLSVVLNVLTPKKGKNEMENK